MKKDSCPISIELGKGAKILASWLATKNINRIEKDFKHVTSYLGYDYIDTCIDTDSDAFAKDDINNLFTLCKPYDDSLKPSVIITINNVEQPVKEEVAFLFNLMNSKFIPTNRIEFFEKIQNILNKHFPTEKHWPKYGNITSTLLSLCFQNDFFPVLANQFIAVTYAARLCVNDNQTPNNQKLTLLLKLRQHYPEVAKRTEMYLVDLYMAEGNYREVIDIIKPHIIPASPAYWGHTEGLNAKLKLKLPASVNEIFVIGRKNTKFVRDKLAALYEEAEKILVEWSNNNGDFLTYIYNKHKHDKDITYESIAGFNYFCFDQVPEAIHFAESLSRKAENILRIRAGLKELKIDNDPFSH